MVKQTTPRTESSSIIWNNLEVMVRMKVREFIQSLLEAEVEDFLCYFARVCHTSSCAHDWRFFCSGQWC